MRLKSKIKLVSGTEKTNIAGYSPFQKVCFDLFPVLESSGMKSTKPLKFQVKTGFSASWKPMFSAFANLNFLPHLAMFVFAVPETGFTLLFSLTLTEGQTLLDIPRFKKFVLISSPFLESC